MTSLTNVKVIIIPMVMITRRNVIVVQVLLNHLHIRRNPIIDDHRNIIDDLRQARVVRVNIRFTLNSNRNQPKELLSDQN